MHDRQLLIMRHAQAAYPIGVSDHRRPLTQTGHEQASLAGAWLRDTGRVPDFILCSSALRTRQTCTWVCDELGEKAPTPKLEDDLYDGGLTGALTLINHTPERVTSLLVISHQPTVQDLVLALASRDSDASAYLDVASGYPTAGIAVLSVDKPWAELDSQDVRLEEFRGDFRASE